LKTFAARASRFSWTLIVRSNMSSSPITALSQSSRFLGTGTLKAWAEELGLDDAAELLQETLDEEQATDEALIEIAKSTINQQAEAAE
jgi:hypothetical protein